MRAQPQLPSAAGAAHGRNLARLLFSAAYRLNITGAGNVPRRGPVILAANHTGFLDGPVLFGSAPRPVHVLTKSEVFTPPFGAVLRSAGQIELVYELPDRRAVRAALAVLADGRAVGVFPEAHRTKGDFARMRHGVAYLHLRTSAPIVPTAIFGIRATGQGKNAVPALRSPIEVVYGEPFTVPGDFDPTRRASVAAAGELIRQRLADHVRLAGLLTGAALPADDVAPDASQAPASPGPQPR